MNNQPHIIQVNITEDKSNSSIPKQMTKGLDARKLVDLLLFLTGKTSLLMTAFMTEEV